MNENVLTDNGKSDSNLAIRIRNLCREMLRFLSELREEKWLAEEKTLAHVREGEYYKRIVGMADTVEDGYEYLLYHTTDEIKAVIYDIEKGVRENVEEFEKIRGKL